MKKYLSLLFIGLLLSACSPFSLVNSESYNNADLSSYKTFRIVTPADGHLPPGMEMVTYKLAELGMSFDENSMAGDYDWPVNFPILRLS